MSLASFEYRFVHIGWSHLEAADQPGVTRHDRRQRTLVLDYAAVGPRLAEAGARDRTGARQPRGTVSLRPARAGPAELECEGTLICRGRLLAEDDERERQFRRPPRSSSRCVTGVSHQLARPTRKSPCTASSISRRGRFTCFMNRHNEGSIKAADSGSTACARRRVGDGLADRPRRTTG